MSCRHCLNHIKSFFPPYFSNYNSVRSHSQTCSYKIPYCHFIFTFYIGISCLKPYKIFYMIYL